MKAANIRPLAIRYAVTQTQRHEFEQYDRIVRAQASQDCHSLVTDKLSICRRDKQTRRRSTLVPTTTASSTRTNKRRLTARTRRLSSLGEWNIARSVRGKAL
jgi:hypothetical protein